MHTLTFVVLEVNLRVKREKERESGAIGECLGDKEKALMV
jgi:hypothetical protein